MNLTKQPIVLAATSTAALMIIGTTLGWFTIGNDLARSFVEDELASKETAAYVTGLISIIATIAAAALKKRGILVISILVSLYAAVMIFNQLPDSESQTVLDISVNAGYWLALLGAISSVAVNGFLVKTGFTDSKTPVETDRS